LARVRPAADATRVRVLGSEFRETAATGFNRPAPDQMIDNAEALAAFGAQAAAAEKNFDAYAEQLLSKNP
jgi:hypothetical protein